MGWVAIKYLAEISHTMVVQMLEQWPEKGPESPFLTVDPVMGRGKWTYQPSPYGSLVVSGVALPLVAAIMASVIGFRFGQAAKAKRS